MCDLKGKYARRAEEIAHKRYGKGFYELSLQQQDKVQAIAIEDVHDRLRDEADNLREELTLGK